jgi:hypothetical protein
MVLSFGAGLTCCVQHSTHCGSYSWQARSLDGNFAVITMLRRCDFQNPQASSFVTCTQVCIRLDGMPCVKACCSRWLFRMGCLRRSRTSSTRAACTSCG